MRPGQHLTRTLVWTDTKVVDGAVNGTAAGIGGLSARMRRWQTGYVRSYALTMLLGVVVLGAILALGVVLMSTDYYLVALMALPILGGLLVAVLPEVQPGLAKKVALGVSILVAALGVAAALQYAPDSAEVFQLGASWSWIPAWGVSFALGVDGISWC